MLLRRLWHFWKIPYLRWLKKRIDAAKSPEEEQDAVDEFIRCARLKKAHGKPLAKKYHMAAIKVGLEKSPKVKPAPNSEAQPAARSKWERPEGQVNYA